MSSSQPAQEPRLLPRLTSLRWCAALGVFLFHLGYLDPSWKPLYLFDIGYTGVTFFYVLSGFVLVWAFQSDPSRWRFYRRRFARIYPATIATGVLAGCLLAGGWFGLHSTPGEFGTGPLGAVTSLFLIQSWFPGNYPAYSYNSVSWSLSCEAFFYLLLPLVVVLAASRRNRSIVLSAAGALALGLLATLLINPHGETGKNIVYINPLIRLPEFLAGVALGILVSRGWQPRIRRSLALVVLLIGAAAPHHWFSLHYLADYMVIPGFVLLLASCIGADLRGTKGPLTSRVSVYLGEVSFCFYLVHYLAMNALVNELGIQHRHYSLLGGAMPVLLILGTSVLLAAALHHAIELPAQRWLRPAKRSPSRPGDSPRAIAAGSTGSLAERLAGPVASGSVPGGPTS